MNYWRWDEMFVKFGTERDGGEKRGEKNVAPGGGIQAKGG